MKPGLALTWTRHPHITAATKVQGAHLLLFFRDQFPVLCYLNRKINCLHKSSRQQEVISSPPQLLFHCHLWWPGLSCQVTKEGAPLQYAIISLETILAYILVVWAAFNLQRWTCSLQCRVRSVHIVALPELGCGHTDSCGSPYYAVPRS